MKAVTTVKTFFIVIIILIIGSRTLCAAPIDQIEQEHKKRLWLKCIYQEYKKLNYKKRGPLTSFMKEELGRTVYNLDLTDAPTIQSKIKITHLFTVGANCIPLLIVIPVIIFYSILGDISITISERQKFACNLIAVIYATFPLFFSMIRPTVSELYQLYGSLILDEIEKEKMNREWRRILNNE